jgi:hypothetical protein
MATAVCIPRTEEQERNRRGTGEEQERNRRGTGEGQGQEMDRRRTGGTKRRMKSDGRGTGEGQERDRRGTGEGQERGRRPIYTILRDTKTLNKHLHIHKFIVFSRVSFELKILKLVLIC